MSGCPPVRRTRVWIRADGNARIASGHLRRCLSVTEALCARGCAVTFLVADEESAAILSGMMPPASAPLCDSAALRERAGEDRAADIGEGADGIHVRVLHTVYDRPETDAAPLAALCAKEPPDFLLIDSYFVNEADFLRLRSCLPDVPLGYMDDLALCDPPVELLIHYGAKPPEAFYKKPARTLLGPMAAPLRGQFAAAGREYAVRVRAERIFLTTGGTDPFDMAGRIIDAIRREPALAALRIEAVLPMIGKAPAEGMESAKDMGGAKCADAAARAADGKLSLHRNVSEMAALMAACDLAVSAGGTTLYELCAVGVPAIAFSMADNQRSFAGNLAETGAIVYAGDVREAADAAQPDRIAERIVRWLADCSADAGERRRQSERMRALTDGRGAERIAEAICGIAEGRQGAASSAGGRAKRAFRGNVR